jgi:hypothetical protein
VPAKAAASSCCSPQAWRCTCGRLCPQPAAPPAVQLIQVPVPGHQRGKVQVHIFVGSGGGGGALLRHSLRGGGQGSQAQGSQARQQHATWRWPQLPWQPRLPRRRCRRSTRLRAGSWQHGARLVDGVNVGRPLWRVLQEGAPLCGVHALGGVQKLL